MIATPPSAELPIIRLPGRVMLPRATRLLKLLEPTVKEIALALRGQRLLAVGLAHPSLAADVRWRTEEPVCVCRVVAVRRHSEGSARLMIRGQWRGTRFSTSHQHGMSFAEGGARVVIHEDEWLDPPTVHWEHRCEELRELLQKAVPGALAIPQVRAVFEQANLGNLCDLIADCIGVAGESGLQLLSAANVELRSDILLDVLRANMRQTSTSGNMWHRPCAN